MGTYSFGDWYNTFELPWFRRNESSTFTNSVLLHFNRTKMIIQHFRIELIFYFRGCLWIKILKNMKSYRFYFMPTLFHGCSFGVLLKEKWRYWGLLGHWMEFWPWLVLYFFLSKQYVNWIFQSARKYYLLLLNWLLILLFMWFAVLYICSSLQRIFL